MVREILAGAFLSSLVACGGGEAMGLHVDPRNAYRGYADFQPDKDKAILAKADSLDAKSAQVRILQEVIPAGIELKDGTFSVAPGYSHVLIGKYAYSPGKLTPKTDLVVRVKRLAVAAGGDAAIVLFIATDGTNFDLAQGIEAMIVKLDPRVAGPPPADAAKEQAPSKSL